MKNEIKDFIHLYLGCDCMYDNGVVVKRPITGQIIDRIHSTFAQATPILRKLSSMTEDEARKLIFLRSPIGSISDGDNIAIVDINDSRIKWIFEGIPNIPRYVNVDELNVNQFQYLLSKGFDLFGLIDANLAIDKDTL